MVPSTPSHSQSMRMISWGENHFSPSLRTVPSWDRMGCWKGRILSSATPLRRMFTSCTTPEGRSGLSSTSMARLLMPHQ